METTTPHPEATKALKLAAEACDLGLQLTVEANHYVIKVNASTFPCMSLGEASRFIEGFRRGIEAGKASK